MGLEEVEKATRRLFGRSMLYVVIWSLGLGAGVIVTPVVTRTLGVVGFGHLVAAQTVGQVFAATVGLGMQAAILRQRVDDDDDKRARGLLFVAITMSLLATAVAYASGPGWSRLLGFGSYSGLIQLMVLWAGPAAITQSAMGLLRAQDRLLAFSIVSLLQSVVAQTCAIALVLIVSRSALTYALGLAISQAFAAAVAVVLTRPRVTGITDRRTVRMALMIGLPLVPQGVAVLVLNAGDRLVIQRLLGAAAVGRYQVGYTVGSLILILMASLNQSWEAVVLAVSDPASRAELIAHARERLLRIILPAVAGVVITSPVVLRAWAPSTFRPEGLLVVTALVCISAFPYAFYLSNVLRLLSVRRTRSLASASVICAAANIGLNFVFIPLMGIAGSALATTVALALQACVTARASARLLPSVHMPIRAIAISAVGGALMLLTVRLPQAGFWLNLRLAAGALCLGWMVAAFRQSVVGQRRGTHRATAARVTDRAAA